VSIERVTIAKYIIVGYIEYLLVRVCLITDVIFAPNDHSFTAYTLSSFIKNTANYKRYFCVWC